jgi:hypothetical protein
MSSLAHEGEIRKHNQYPNDQRDTSKLMTTTALLLDGRASHRAVGAKNATVARLGFEQYLTVRALVKILARVRRHGLFALLSTTRAGENGL